MHIPLSYPVLRMIWWLLLGVILIGFAIMDGFDFGVGMLLPFIAKKDIERRVVINTVGPVWEGNQVWFVLGGGVLFAAWPTLYAVSFSSLYLAMLVVLLAMILRPVAFKFRSKLTGAKWRCVWDWILFFSGLVPPLIFGVALGNVLQGVPFHFDETLRSFYTGSFFGLLNPFALLCGLISVSMLVMHGALYLATKTHEPIQSRGVKIARVFSVILIVLFALAGVWIAYGIQGYYLIGQVLHNGASNPLHKQVGRAVGAWLSNYQSYPWLLFAPALGFLGAFMVFLFAKYSKFAFLNSAISILGIVATFGVSTFPFLFPSSTAPNMSLLVWDSSSSRLTLFVMLIAACIFLPIILFYTSWVYRVLRGKVSAEYIENNEHMTY